jgi:RNA polymerase sigma-70 factor (ECF subfamily)
VDYAPERPAAPNPGSDDIGLAVRPDVESARWVAELRAGPDTSAHQRLHELLVRTARSEVNRRSVRLRVSGAELDDLAYQAAADAMVSILRRLGSFRGESRFTTWAYKFVIFEVSNKIGRHFWINAPDALDSEQWERLPDRFAYTPEQAAASSDLFAAIQRSVREDLTAHQREVFVAIVVNGVPLDALSARLHTNRNALYKAVFDARRKIRAHLVANGYIVDDRTGVDR